MKDSASDKVEVEPMTTKSMRPRASYGSLIGSVQSIRGLCDQLRCFRKAGHPGSHYPQ